MFKLGSIYYVIFVFNICLISAKISDKRLCADKDCSVKISEAIARMAYGGGESGMLAFKPNDKITIYSKAAGNNKDVWGAEINGRRGYVPIHQILENKVYTKKLDFIVDTEQSEPVENKFKDNQHEASAEKPSPDRVKAVFEVIDGTTVYPNDEDNITSTSMNSAVQPDLLHHKQTEPLKSTVIENISIKSQDGAPLEVNSQGADKQAEPPLPRVIENDSIKSKDGAPQAETLQGKDKKQTEPFITRVIENDSNIQDGAPREANSQAANRQTEPPISRVIENDSIISKDSAPQAETVQGEDKQQTEPLITRVIENDSIKSQGGAPQEADLQGANKQTEPPMPRVIETESMNSKNSAPQAETVQGEDNKQTEPLITRVIENDSIKSQGGAPREAGLKGENKQTEPPKPRVFENELMNSKDSTPQEEHLQGANKKAGPFISQDIENESSKSKDNLLATNLESENMDTPSSVGNIISTVTNWIIEGSGLYSAGEEQEPRGESNDELDDVEIEDEDGDTYSGNEELEITTSHTSKDDPTSTVDHLHRKLPDDQDTEKISNSIVDPYPSKNSETKPLNPKGAEHVEAGALEQNTLKEDNLALEFTNKVVQETRPPQLEVLQEKLAVQVISVSSNANDIKSEIAQQKNDFSNNKILYNTNVIKENSSSHNDEIIQLPQNREEESKPKQVDVNSEDKTLEQVKDARDKHAHYVNDNKDQTKDSLKLKYENNETIESLTKKSDLSASNLLDSNTKLPESASDSTVSSNRDSSFGNTKDGFAASETEIPAKTVASVHQHGSSESGYPLHSQSFEHHHHQVPSTGIFSNIFSHASENETLNNINNDINAKETSSVQVPSTESFGTTEMHNVPDTSFSKNIDFTHTGDNDGSINVIIGGEETQLNKIYTQEADVTELPPESVSVQTGHKDEEAHDMKTVDDHHMHDMDALLSKPHSEDQASCLAGFKDSDCPNDESLEFSSVATDVENIIDFYYLQLPVFSYEVCIVLVITAVTVVVFLWGYIYIDRHRKEAPLVAKINSLQKQFLILKTENDIVTEKLLEVENDSLKKAKIVSTEIVEDLKYQLTEAENVRLSLEQQIQNLEKELENSTEVGLELNRMLSEFLNSDNGSDTLISNIDQLQRQLVEQQGTINSYNETLSIKETENHELRLELEINNSRVNELQSELNKMALNLLKLEEDKDQLQANYETDITSLKVQLDKNASNYKSEITKISEQLNLTKQMHEESQRKLEMKINEYKLLKENINRFNNDNNNGDALKSMFDSTSIKAELLQLCNENKLLNERLRQESSRTSAFEKQAYLAMEDAQLLKTKYDNADQEKMEAQTKLEILSNYFKEREAQLQKELSKQESMWTEKQGEATSTIERIKYMQEELQNNKAQYESLKQEIVAQEVEMKSQISVLEKKAHENWVAARQAERKLEDAKQEAAQLRNRLTLRERNFNEDKIQNRLVSPLEQNGDLSLNDTGTSLPLMFGTRDLLTTSPPLPSLPHFLPPPPGVQFIPPPLGGVPMIPPGFLPPPPSMIPGDHRPPPLGRMSSPPLNSRYSPDSRAYSPYSRNSPSPTSDDEYDHHLYRSYSPYNREDRREFPRPPPPNINRNSIRNHRGTTHSSGSAHSNESLEKINRHNSKV